MFVQSRTSELLLLTGKSNGVTDWAWWIWRWTRQYEQEAAWFMLMLLHAVIGLECFSFLSHLKQPLSEFLL